MKEKYIVGVDIGGGSIKSGVYDAFGAELKHNTVVIPNTLTNDTFLEAVNHSISPLVQEFSISGIGIGSPGPLDNEKGILIESANMQTLHNVKIKSFLESKYNLPVLYENDANCAALGEAIFGTYKNSSSLLILTLGTGLGGGFVNEGKLYSGFQGNGIEIGHMTAVIDGALCGCGQKGCVEAYFSTKGFLARYKELTNVTLSDAESFFLQIKKGDKDAEKILNFSVLALAETIRSAIHLLNPEAVVFVGGITKAWDLFGTKLESLIREKIFTVLNDRLKIGVGGNLAGSLGAASLFFQNK
ncbi:MAG: ROK family protein [Leptospira sp.]|nr:ROK family protein [Leptospira sp.]